MADFARDFPLLFVKHKFQLGDADAVVRAAHGALLFADQATVGEGVHPTGVIT